MRQLSGVQRSAITRLHYANPQLRASDLSGLYTSAGAKGQNSRGIGAYSAACALDTCTAFSRMVTSSSAAVGCTAMTRRNRPWSPSSSPRCRRAGSSRRRPGRRCGSRPPGRCCASTTSLKNDAGVAAGTASPSSAGTRSCRRRRADSARRACASVRPMTPTSGSENTAVGTSSWSTLRRLAAEHGVGEGVALADRDRRQVDAVGDVADGVDVRHRGLREGVDRDRRRSWRASRRPSRVRDP